MNSIEKAKSISIWIFIVPFVAVNTCLLLVTQFHSLFPILTVVISFLWSANLNLVSWCIPNFEGCTSISRVGRYPVSYTHLTLPTKA